MSTIYVASTVPTPHTGKPIMLKALIGIAIFVLMLIGVAALVVIAIGLGLFLIVFLSFCIANIGLDDTLSIVKYRLRMFGGIR